MTGTKTADGSDTAISHGKQIVAVAPQLTGKDDLHVIRAIQTADKTAPVPAGSLPDTHFGTYPQWLHSVELGAKGFLTTTVKEPLDLLGNGIAKEIGYKPDPSHLNPKFAGMRESAKRDEDEINNSQAGRIGKDIGIGVDAAVVAAAVIYGMVEGISALEPAPVVGNTFNKEAFTQALNGSRDGFRNYLMRDNMALRMGSLR
jgi:hypothetical protein